MTLMTTGRRDHLLTEQPLASARDLDTRSTASLLGLINEQDATIPAIVGGQISAIAALVDAIVPRMKRGGRLVYLGAGTSGRLGVLDASECPPTYQSDPQQVVGLIAGGDTALRRSSEGAEDDPEGAGPALDELAVGGEDTVIGIAAGGTTPYVLGGLAIAAGRGACTALLCCVPHENLPPLAVQCDHRICLPVGPEVVAGSTRMRAGTATKLALNMISTAIMVQLGKTWGHLMVDLRASNAKLRDRALRMLCEQCDLPRQGAARLLAEAGGQVKLALVMHHRQLTAAEAESLLARNDGRLRSVLGMSPKVVQAGNGSGLKSACGGENRACDGRSL